MYQVLYRKWRPKTFSEVVGQPHITTALKNEIRTGRLAHAYLFVGSRGTGKTSCAKILAKAVNCLHPVDGDPCGECEICRGIDDGSILDVTELDAASNNGVDYVRELREEVAYMPAAARYRVYIIDEVHMMSDSAFNALLKTLEEPPAHVIFILATTEVHELPDTILSRCQRFDFGRIAAEEIAARLQHIAENESFTLAPDAALMLARLADGGMRDALSLLDQCVSRTDEVTLDTVSEAAGIAGRDELYRLSAAIRAGDSGDALSLIDRLHNSSKDMERLCVEVLDFFRQLMIVKQVKDPGSIIILPPAEIERLQTEAQSYTLPAVLHCLDVLQQTLTRLRAGASRRLEMEMAVVKLCSPALDSRPEALTRRVKALEDALRGGATLPAQPATPVAATPAPKPAPVKPAEPAPAPKAEPAPEASAPPPSAEEAPFTGWSEVLETLATSCPPLYGVLMGSTATIRGEHVLIATGNEMFKTLVSRDGNHRVLADAIRKTTGRDYRIGLKKVAPAPAETHEDESDNPLSAFLKESRENGLDVTVKES